jgi:hypothetical protein
MSTPIAIPEGYIEVAHREDHFLHTDLYIYRKFMDGQYSYILVINNKMSGPYGKHELECLQDSLKNDITLK